MTDKTKTISVRLPLETVEEIEEKLKKEGITLRQMLTEYPKLRGSKSVNTAKIGISHNLEQMLFLMGYTVEEGLKILEKSLEDGVLEVKDGRFTGQTEIDLNEFYDVCHEKNIRPEDAIKKCITMLWRS